jgi:anti-anti-sigma regulatory factor
LERITKRSSADRFAPSRPDRHRRGLNTPDAELVELLPSLGSVITVRVGHPLTLVEAIDMQQKVQALIARRPAAIVLDVAEVIPIDEMGPLMLSSVARQAAEDGIAVALANVSPPLRGRLAQLGVPNLTFINGPAPTAPTPDTHGQETDSRSVPPPTLRPKESTGLTKSGLSPAHTGTGIHDETVPQPPSSSRPHS